ncbi:adenylate kinase [Schleiferilactobacillus perolens]|jgi:adenylate kinase|uniref:Adenylate kinase n=1 Tax=Schleiferilactobacillus perolens DSM 12744 TaxID=1423792 RepID=A0A0R1N6P4_9LACO|nr:adenylate kinase [Schleiferilactobacillus perolens]KRL13282.1 adenylate kinase [Schleiferilactobacillus perolens DSM 12744]MCI1891755.1 adenylate kinase [Schleiferilactobacillus harbinensis]MCI1912642.1 adenylate kinase [Schleiferilactobacillus harbinensis]MCI2171436.1 adenylate kinase [Schleiferilactobacillus perolens]
MNLMLMGLPGAGKGTQAERIEDAFPIVHISTGDMFREAMANETPVGLQAKSYIDKGNLVPDSVTDALVKERLSQPDVDKGYMLDGYPRNINQAHALDDITAELNKPLDAVIDIQVDPDKLMKRLSGRIICKNCGATYNKFFNPPKVAGTCDRCGHHEFYQRDDDKPETVKNRLDVNIKMNTPLIDFYQKKGILHRVNGDQDIDSVFAEVKQVLQQFAH